MIWQRISRHLRYAVSVERAMDLPHQVELLLLSILPMVHLRRCFCSLFLGGALVYLSRVSHMGFSAWPWSAWSSLFSMGRMKVGR